MHQSLLLAAGLGIIGSVLGLAGVLAIMAHEVHGGLVHAAG
jgi:hypothetical protein